MAQAIRMTTTVRIAVARLDGTPSIPILAKIDVKAAKTADKSAKKNHMANMNCTPKVRQKESNFWGVLL